VPATSRNLCTGLSVCLSVCRSVRIINLQNRLNPWKGKERKSIYIAPFAPRYTQSAQAWITQFYLQTTPRLPFPRGVHQMSPPQQLRQQTSNCSALLINRPRKDERLSWLSWLEMPFGIWTRMVPKNHALDGGPGTPLEGAIFRRGEGRPIAAYRGHTAVSCGKGAEPNVMPFGTWIRVDARKHTLDGGCTLTPPGEYEGTVRVRRRCGLMSNYFDHCHYYEIRARSISTADLTMTSRNKNSK